MIKRVTRKALNVEKYNYCIEHSLQSNIFGFSWYLDIVCDNWDVFVLNDYEAVMPVPWRKKFFIKYGYPPLWIIQLGIYSLEIEDENEFLIELFSEFKYIETRTNASNAFTMFQPFQKQRQLQVLEMPTTDYKTVFTGYRKDRKKDLKKAQKNDLHEKWNDNPNSLINLHKANVGKRAKDFSEQEYEKLEELIKVCVLKKVGEILSIYDKDSKLVGSGFFLKHKDRTTILVSSTDFKNRKNGANTFLIDRAIYKYQARFNKFDFGGSSMRSIAKYFLSFGASSENYMQLNYNNLPSFLKLLKK